MRFKSGLQDGAKMNYPTQAAVAAMDGVSEGRLRRPLAEPSHK